MMRDEQYRRWCDRIVASGIFCLLVCTPLAFGAVHPWAFMVMEALTFLLTAIWMLRLLLSPTAAALPRGCSLALPLFLFFGFLMFQLTPLPPSVVQALSPATYGLYSRSLPGWPEKMPYADWVALDASEFQVPGSRFQIPSFESQVSPQTTQHLALNTQHSPAGPWLPLSLAPELSRSDLFKLLAYAGIFLLVFSYPFGEIANHKEAEERFYRQVLRVVFGMGVIVAFLGIVQRFTWNGKILWFFVPHDWPAPLLTDAPRASGPFVNSDHFANYLAMMLPLALAGLVSRSAFVDRNQRTAARLMLSVNIVLLLMGLLLSLSRGGWGGAVLGVALLMWFLPGERRQRLLGINKRQTARMLLSVTAVGLVAALSLIGESGRSQVDRRLEQTVMQDASFEHRFMMWRDSMAMVRDFPMFGVGLGAWPEVFPRYQQPPWSPNFAREAHNDYVEGLAELGVVGLALLAWFFVTAGVSLYQGLLRAPTKFAPVYAALLASLGAMAFQEGFDFNLQIPANAVLFTIFLALALRLAVRSTSAEGTVPSRPFQRTVSCVVMAGVALTLCLSAFTQERTPYPDNLRTPTLLTEARETLLSYPALSSMHLALFELTKDRVPIEQRLPELETALWLEPHDPYLRDVYAQELRQHGREQEGLLELTRSVASAPQLSAHETLSSEHVGVLTREEQQAVEAGLTQALAGNWLKVAPELGRFYNALGRYVEAGNLYEAIAMTETSEGGKLLAFLLGGAAFVRAGELTKAENLLFQAVELAPRDPRAYRQLISQVYAAKEDLDAARTLVAQGMRKGVDPIPLRLAFAQAAHKLGNREAAKSALIEVLPKQGGSFDVLAALGRVYLQEKNFDRAAMMLRRAVKLKPDEASVVYALAQAEEGRYRFAAAQDAYLRALNLDPKNDSVRGRYEALQRKVLENQ